MLLRFGDGHWTPHLHDWIPMEALDEIHRSIQEIVNQAAYGGGEEVAAGVSLGAVRFSRSGTTFLQAEGAELRVDGPMIDPRDSDKDSDEFNPMVLMKLTGVSKLRMPWQSVPKRVSGRLPPISESTTEAVDDGGASVLRRRTSDLNNSAKR
ncbi:unnamed protein product [Prorocentrum cordatum]|uniref:Uncharacterized protein n=1 Tax=Prorocentrum cordatum TaxID=2364126 RepID=A0ABN9VLS8_9DINO|nr:unnamed protein product [Polarella glacialis]